MTRTTINNLNFTSPEVIDVPFTPGRRQLRCGDFRVDSSSFLEPLAQFIQFAHLSFEINCGADDDRKARVGVGGSCKALLNRTHLTPQLTKMGATNYRAGTCHCGEQKAQVRRLCAADQRL